MAMTGGTAEVVRGPAEDLCLAFANTRFWRGTGTPTETLLAPADLLRWSGEAGFEAEVLRRIAARWEIDPASGTAALTAAIDLRELLYRLFARVAAGDGTSDSELAAFNSARPDRVARAVLRHGPDGTGWVVEGGSDVGLLLAPVLWSAGDMLAGQHLPRVRCCANARCVWLFLDDSKGGTRRWCSMSACGNRAKAHRHYAKLKAARG